MTSADPPGAGAWRPRDLDVPIRPGATLGTSCPWGHELAIGGVLHGRNQDYDTPEYLCEACHGLPDHGGRWALLDVALTHQVVEDQVEENRLQLVVTPPPIRHGTGTIRLQLGSTIFGHVEITLCELDRRAVLLHIEVEPKHRRRGAGRVLAAAAHARAPGYTWSTNPIGTEPVAIAFWARVGVPGPAPAWACSHQIQAGAVPENARWTRWW